ncbi:FAD-dependent oxidoreductase, partial [Blautia sp.]|uniref:FAD-dependent oxidoreductase n=1 Tax=Blautia sp. TaxID=1955243 RepID=UPI003A901D9D
DEMYHSVPGLEHAKIVKNAYAIEYDCINPRQLYPTLEFKKIKGLFSHTPKPITRNATGIRPMIMIFQKLAS